MRRLDAERNRPGLFALAFILAISGANCAKTWVLGGNLGEAGAGGGTTIGSGGSSGSSGFPGQGGRSGSMGSGGHGSSCMITEHINYDIPTSDMIFFVGRNLSMSTRFGDNGMTRMTAVQAALHTVTKANENAVYFGYQDFPSLSGCKDGSTCCASKDIPVSPVPGNAEAIDSALNQCGQGQSMSGCVAQNDSRTVAQALGTATDIFGPTRDITSNRYVVLITDGPPGCVTEAPQDACSSALTVLSSWAHSSIKTYVIGIGDAAQDQQCLASIALMGQTSTPLFDVADSSALLSALNKIVNPATSAACTLELLANPGDPSLVSVFLQGRELCYDSSRTNGWSYAQGSTMRIVINGSDCAAVQATPPPLDLAVLSGCPPHNTFSCP